MATYKKMRQCYWSLRGSPYPRGSESTAGITFGAEGYGKTKKIVRCAPEAEKGGGDIPGFPLQPETSKPHGPGGTAWRVWQSHKGETEEGSKDSQVPS